MQTSIIRIRPAVPADIPVLRALIEASVRGLQAQDYTPTQLESALKSVYGVDSQLIADGTYYVAEANPAEACSTAVKSDAAKPKEPRVAETGVPEVKDCTATAGRCGLWWLEQAQDTLWRRPLDWPRGRAA